MANQTKSECCLEEFDKLYSFFIGPMTNGNDSWNREQMEKFCHGDASELREKECVPAHLTAQMNMFTRPIYGYVSPCLGIFTLVTNILVCLVLLKQHMRNPTNLLLAAMAIADLLTGIIPIPMFVYFYTLGHYKEWLTCSLLYSYNVMAINLPTTFHTASIWLTVALAIQRYMCVCKPIPAKRWCNIQNVLTAIGAIYLFALISQSTRFFDQKYMSVDVPSLLQRETIIQGCIEQDTVLTDELQDIYWHLYWWFRVVFVHILPCATLVVMNALLITTMRAAQTKRAQLLKQNRNSECRRLQENNRTTFMLVAVVGVFLLVELPLAVLLILMILQNTFYPNLLDVTVNDLASIIINMFILLSYPINFFIYCGMSRQFRDTFIDVIKEVCGQQKPEEPVTGRTRYMSLTTEAGNKMAVATTETAM